MVDRKPERATFEVHPAYRDENVLRALFDTSWFTADYIITVRNSFEPDPLDDLSSITPEHRRFLDSARNLTGKEIAYIGAKNFLFTRMVSGSLHPYPLDMIPFADEEFFAQYAQYGVTPEYQVDRGMIFTSEAYLSCLIAPEHMRKKIVKQMCRWGEGYEDTKRDVLIWAELTRRGTEHYLKRRERLKRLGF